MSTLYFNALLATMLGSLPFGRLDNGAVVVRDGFIVAAGTSAEILALYGASSEKVDVGGRLITPALIDAHTHLVFAGDRSQEFARRARGESYADIAASGGGILSTVRATREASFETLLELACERARVLHAEGVRTIEIKSGYGLTLDDELRMLRVARAVAEHVPVRVSTTLLAAHAVPPEYRHNSDAYVDLICERIIPAARYEGLADAVDVFCESIGFSLAQTERIFAAAIANNLPIKGHTEQLSNVGGSALAASMGARSVDHLEYLDSDGVAAMARSGTVAMLLPNPFVHIGETQKPPVVALREAGVELGVASDFNPGSAPLLSLRLAMNLACSVFRLRTEESLAGVTAVAARALGFDKQIGSIEPGKRADLLVWPAGVTPDRLAAEFSPQIAPIDLAALPTAYAPYELWRGRVDTEDGANTRRWHQVVTPLIESSPLPNTVVLLGFACDAGVRRNLGRPGAASGPAAIRSALANLAWHGSASLADGGDVRCSNDELEAAQQQYATLGTSVVSAGAFCIGLGGGHEIAWASWLAIRNALPGKRIGVINLDAHLDLRNPTPRASSGTPFAQIAADSAARNSAFLYLCIGASRPNNTTALFDKARDLGATVIFDIDAGERHLHTVRQQIDAFADGVDAIYLTLDLDVFSGHVAPGVSAPAAVGLSPAAVLAHIDAIFDTGKVRIFDVAELNPRFDSDNRTARIAARMVSHVAERSSEATSRAEIRREPSEP